MYKIQKMFENPPQSYWIASTPKTGYPSLNDHIKVDVAIVGGGMTGISCAYLLNKEGLKVAIVEADRILQGTTGHTTAKVTSQHGLIYHKIKSQMNHEYARQYADANEAAIKFIEKTTNDLDINCDYTPQSSYVFTQQDKYIQKINDEVITASHLGIKASFVDQIPFDIEIKAGVRFDEQAQFHPRKYLISLADEITHNGGRIYEQSRIIDIDQSNTYILTTEQGKKITAEKIIIASHYPFYNKAGLYFSRIYTERSYVIGIQAKEKYPGGMYITAEEPTRSLRSQSTENGELILVGGEHHKTGQGINTTKHYEALVDYALNNFTVENIPYRWSTQDCMTMDDVPYIGLYTSKTPNLYIATGYGKWGMTNSTVSAMILRDLIVHGKSVWEEVYNPSRDTVTASAKNFLVENLNVAKVFVEGKRLSLPNDVEIKPGEGKVVESNGQRTGAYRDEQGKLHLIDTTCTHMGCELNWNAAEKSWDCPCHGSRFTFEGKIIEGPAVRPLQVYQEMNPIKKLLKDDF